MTKQHTPTALSQPGVSGQRDLSSPVSTYPWSGIRESNSRLWLGKPAYYHCTNPARRRGRAFSVSVVLALAFASVLARPALGQERIAAFLGTDALSKGFTVRSADRGILLGLGKGVFSQSLTLSIDRTTVPVAPLPTNWKAVSDFWTFTIGQDQPENPAKPIQLRLRYRSETRKERAIYLAQGTQWQRISSVDRPLAQTMAGKLTATSGQLVVLEDDRQFEGVASWYRSGKYPYGAANNELPMGSRARVTNLTNGKSVVVTVVSRGPFVQGRIIDLSHTAFAVIAPRGAGLARVRVEPLAGAGSAAANPPSATPSVAASSALVYDPATKTAVWEKDAGKKRPIASITKLMTALVFVETKPDFQAVVTMQAEDIPNPEAGVRIALGTGETITVHDLFETMLTGSANNSALALVRSTGLTTNAFVARMNAKAAELGLANTHFDDPTGLATTNVSTATELAQLVTVAFAQSEIRQASIQPSYRYAKVNSGERRSVRNPLFLYNHLLDTSPVYGAKTGFINEAGHCVALEAIGASGKHVVVVVLGSPTTTTRSRDAKTLIDWAANRF